MVKLLKNKNLLTNWFGDNSRAQTTAISFKHTL